MSSDLFMGLTIGFGVGILTMLLMTKFILSNIVKQSRSNFWEQEEREDPANWWKKGLRNPYEPRDNYESDPEE